MTRDQKVLSNIAYNSRRFKISSSYEDAHLSAVPRRLRIFVLSVMLVRELQERLPVELDLDL